MSHKAGCTITGYYYFNGQRIAMRVQSDANATGTVSWLHGDMLGSASVATDASGNKIGGSDPSTLRQAQGPGRYMPFGEVRSGSRELDCRRIDALSRIALRLRGSCRRRSAFYRSRQDCLCANDISGQMLVL